MAEASSGGRRSRGVEESCCTEVHSGVYNGEQVREILFHGMNHFLIIGSLSGRYMTSNEMEQELSGLRILLPFAQPITC